MSNLTQAQPKAKNDSFKQRARAALLSFFGPRCFYCGNQFDKSRLTLDHRTPKSIGGAGNIYNLSLACQKCNSQKGARTLREYKLARGVWEFPGEKLLASYRFYLTLPEVFWETEEARQLDLFRRWAVHMMWEAMHRYAKLMTEEIKPSEDEFRLYFEQLIKMMAKNR